MRILTISKKVITELIRDKRSLALMFIAPLLILWLMNVMFSASSDITITLGTSGVKAGLVKKLDKVSGVSVKKYPNVSSAKRALKKGQADSIIVKDGNRYVVTHANTDSSKTLLAKNALKPALIKQQTSQAKEQGQKMQILLKKQQAAIAKLTTALAKVSGQKAATVKAKNKQETASASSVKIVNHYQYGDKDTGYFAKIAPVLMAFFIFFFVFLISGMALLGERTSGTLDRLLATPVKRSDIVFGYLLGYGLLGFLQAVVICLAGIYILNIEIVGSLAAVVTVCVLFAFVALAFGLLLSTFAESEFQMMQFIPPHRRSPGFLFRHRSPFIHGRLGPGPGKNFTLNLRGRRHDWYHYGRTKFSPSFR